MLLAKEKESGKVLMAEDDLWLDMTDDEGGNEEQAKMCFMGKQNQEEYSDDDECYSESGSEIII